MWLYDTGLGVVDVVLDGWRVRVRVGRMERREGIVMYPLVIMSGHHPTMLLLLLLVGYVSDWVSSYSSVSWHYKPTTTSSTSTSWNYTLNICRG